MLTHNSSYICDTTPVAGVDGWRSKREVRVAIGTPLGLSAKPKAQRMEQVGLAAATPWGSRRERGPHNTEVLTSEPHRRRPQYAFEDLSLVRTKDAPARRHLRLRCSAARALKKIHIVKSHNLTRTSHLVLYADHRAHYHVIVCLNIM